MGPPEEVDAEEELEGSGDVGVLPAEEEDGGRVSHERVRRQDWRTSEKEVGWRGSWVDV